MSLRGAMPAAQLGEPSRDRPIGAERSLAWVATLVLENVTPADPDPYPGKSPQDIVNINRALSMVSKEELRVFDLCE